VTRTIASVLGLALVLTLLSTAVAPAEFRGTDMWSNVAPNKSSGDLVDRHPLSYYELDVYIDGPSIGLGGVKDGDPVARVMQGAAAFLFALAIFCMRMMISIFDWAFNLDIIGGRNGALDPVSKATQHLYTSTFSQLMTTAVLVMGGWLIYKLISRKFSEAGSALARGLLLSTVALVIIFNPAATIGKLSSMTSELAGGIVSTTTGAKGGGSVSDRLFDTFVYRPWAVLNFGGLERCVSGQKDDDGFPVSTGVNDPDRKICRNVLRRERSGYGGYAPMFLRYAPGSDERKAAFEAIRDGEIPDVPVKDCNARGCPDERPGEGTAQFAGWNVDKADAPAADLMQSEGAGQRLVYAFVFAFGIACAIAFIGLICLTALFTKLALLVLFAAAPAMAVAAFFPAAHGVVGGWLKMIGKALIWFVVYAILLSASVGVSAALMYAAGGGMGILVAFVLQALLFGGLVAKRKDIASWVANKRDYRHAESTTKSFVVGSASAAVGAIAAPVSAAGAAAGAVKSKMGNRQEPAPAPENVPKNNPAEKPGERKMPADSSSPPASAGREYSPNPPVQPGEPAESPVAARAATATATTAPREEEPVPIKTFQQDYEHAQAERSKPYGAPREPIRPPERAPVVAPEAAPPAFSDHLEHARKQQKAAMPE
jgi:hypothetical protein